MINPPESSWHQAFRLKDYCISRGAVLGPVSQDFGAACDQIDRADLMLADLHERARQGLAQPEQAWPETDGPRIIALVGRDPESQTVSLILDATTANTVMFAVAAHAEEREAHVREVDRFAQSLPDGSYGQRNRQAIAARETRVATRLRAVEQAHRTASERDIVFRPPEPARAWRSPEHAPDREMELELECRVNPYRTIAAATRCHHHGEPSVRSTSPRSRWPSVDI